MSDEYRPLVDKVKQARLEQLEATAEAAAKLIRESRAMYTHADGLRLRQLAIADTHFQEAFAALRRSLQDNPSAY